MKSVPSWLNLTNVWLPYTQMKGAELPLPVVSAEGVRLRLADGRELIDGVASWWTACHGYGHPHILRKVREQLEKLPHVMFGGLAHEPAYELAKRLTRILPGDLQHVFFSESGSVAVEVALKMAVQFWLNGGERRTKFLSFVGGYHGDTFAAMSICDPEEGMHRMFRGVAPEQFVREVPDTAEKARDLDAWLANHHREIAAVIVEPLIQGAGGMRFFDAEVLVALRGLCDRHNVLLIFDEIFTGFGRSGTMFACDAARIAPDIICLGKALTGGTLPLAATIASKRVFEGFLSDEAYAALMHGPTFMGNPLACAAANASLDLFETEPRLKQVKAIAAQMLRELAQCRDLSGVVDVRVRGAVGVVQMGAGIDVAALRSQFVKRGVWVKPFGDVIYLTPPFVIGEAELSQLTEAVAGVVSEI
jgi:adenosylmethionine---8-amino-7-oxononanoate aminotransferase